MQCEQTCRLEKRLCCELQQQMEERDKSIAILDDALYKSRLTLQVCVTCDTLHANM